MDSPRFAERQQQDVRNKNVSIIIADASGCRISPTSSMSTYAFPFKYPPQGSVPQTSRLRDKITKPQQPPS